MIFKRPSMAYQKKKEKMEYFFPVCSDFRVTNYLYKNIIYGSTYKLVHLIWKIKRQIDTKAQHKSWFLGVHRFSIWHTLLTLNIVIYGC